MIGIAKRIKTDPAVLIVFTSILIPDVEICIQVFRTNYKKNEDCLLEVGTKIHKRKDRFVTEQK
jgi:hypothetical protein